MTKTHILAIAAVALGAAACADAPYEHGDRYSYNSPPPGGYVAPTRYYGDGASASDHGRVVAIDVVRDSGRATGGGALLGGIAGGVLGHQIGNGRGNTAATVAGAVGGAVVGNEIEKRHGGGDYYRVTVQFPDGHEETYTRDTLGDLHVGDRVRVDGGRVERD
jgi:outer membrane lipoprotein SlyB